MNPARFRWGILFILAGVLLLLNNLDLLAWWVWADILSLWPILLIAIGIEKIFSKSKYNFVSYLTSVGLVIAVAWVAISGVRLSSFSNTDYTYKMDPDPDITQLVSTIRVDDRDISIRPSRSDVFTVKYDGFGPSPDIDYKKAGAMATIAVKERKGLRWIHFRDGRRERINLTIGDEIPIDLSCFGDDADMRLDFRDIRLQRLRVESNDGRIRIYLGNGPKERSVSIGGDDADYRLWIPKNAGLRVSGADISEGRYLRRIGLEKSDDLYESPGYDTLSQHIELNLGSDYSQLSIDFY